MAAKPKTDSVAIWRISLPDGVHEIEFEHGTTSGKRVIWVDGKDIKREEWMFKLVGREHFTIGKTSLSITIDAVSGFSYEYTLEVNGKCLKEFCDRQRKKQKAWRVPIGGELCRVCLELDSLDIWVNGDKVESIAEFTDEGTERHFEIFSGCPAMIKTISSGKRKTGLVHSLIFNDREITDYCD